MYTPVKIMRGVVRIEHIQGGRTGDASRRGSGTRLHPARDCCYSGREQGQTRVGESQEHLPNEASTSELGLDEELSVENVRGRVEGRSGDGRVNEISGCDGVRGEEGNDLGRGEASGVSKAGEDAVDGIKRLWHGLVLCRESRVLTAQKELKTGSTRAVRDADSARELDEVADRDLRMRLNEWRLRVNDVVNTAICMECGFRGREDDHRAVSTGSLELARLGEANGIVEGKTEDFVSYIELVSVCSLDKILLQVYSPSSPQVLSNKFSCKSSRRVKNLQH